MAEQIHSAARNNSVLRKLPGKREENGKERAKVEQSLSKEGKYPLSPSQIFNSFLDIQLT